MKSNLYKILGISRTANLDEIRTAYRALARRFHPDKNIEIGETELFLGVQSAYEILSDPEKRADYDRNLPKDLVDQPSVKLLTTYSRTSLTRINERQLLYVLLELVPQIHANIEHSPLLNLCLVLDVSTSMQGRTLDMVKSTTIKLIREMREQDILSIITFSDRAEILIPAGMVNDPKSIEMKVQMLSTSGGTEIFQGLEKGFIEVNRYRNVNRINHIILLTDGRTYGDEEDCLLLARQAADQGISISGLGIGNKWNDDFLDEMTSITGGNSLFVSTPTEILSFMSEKFRGLRNAFAHNVTFVFNLHENVELQYAYRLQPDASALVIGSPLALGSIQEKTSLRVLFEFMIHGLRDTVGELVFLDGTISLDIPTNIQSRENHILQFFCPTDIAYNTEYPHQKIVDAMTKLTLYRMQEQARKEIAEGTKAQAAKRLQSMATQLINRGEKELAKVVLDEIQNIQQKDGFTEDGGKRIKYGTRNLLLPGVLEDRL